MAALTLLRSRKLIAPFAVHAPTTVESAVALKAAKPDAAYMAGGIELADRMKNGIACSDLIRLNAIPELNAVSLQDGCLHIGATTPHRLVSQHHLIRQHLLSFADAVATIGSPRIRTQGTIGGNLMSHAWHYDMLPMLMALSAKAVFSGPDGARREGAIDAVISAPSSDLLVEIVIAVANASRTFLFQRVDKPVLSLAVAITTVDQRALSARVVLASAGHPPIARDIVAEHGAVEASVRNWRQSLVELCDDRTSSAWYRAELAEVRLRRMLTQAMDDRP